MINVALVFGGKSPEHQISVRSAKNIYAALDDSLFAVQLIGIDLDGAWRLLDTLDIDTYVPKEAPQLALIPGRTREQIVLLDTLEPIPQPDILYLTLHGPQGEDGTVQGLIRILDLPFIGPDVLGSSVAMDKDVAKRLLAQAGLNVARGYVFHAYQKEQINYHHIVEDLGLPVFVKPANMGSSVGVHKVRNELEFATAVEDAFQYDTKILIEEMIHGREVECAVLGNGPIQATTVGEVITAEEYSYEAKYISTTAATIQIPAEGISEENIHKLRTVAQQAYLALGCEVLSRVDMFLSDDGSVYVNEINTLPGFTNISMYPQLWQYEGVSASDLSTRLIQLAIERFRDRKQLKTVF